MKCSNRSREYCFSSLSFTSGKSGVNNSECFGIFCFLNLAKGKTLLYIHIEEVQRLKNS